MPEITLLPSDANLGNFLYHLTAMEQAVVILSSPTQIIMSGGGATYTLTGSGFTLTTIGGVQYINSGTIDGIAMTMGSASYQMSLVNLSGTALQAALVAEVQGTDQGALEALFLSMAYTVNGTVGNDVHIVGATTSEDGQSLQLTGPVTYNLDAGNDYVLDASIGNDLIFGGAGNDTLHGNSGDDTIDGGADADLLRGDAGNDSLLGGLGIDTLYGGAGDDTIVGGEGKDITFGGAGNDVFRQVGGEFGADVYGGEGIDLLDLSGWATLDTGFSVDLETEVYGLFPNSFGSDGIYLLQGVENVTGSNFIDEIAGALGDSLLDGRGGNDTILGRDGNDTLIGGGGSDLLFGDADNDSLTGDGGRDTLEGGTGNDTLRGGLDNDTLVGDDGDDLLFGDSGIDDLFGGIGNDTIDGGGSKDVSFGGDGDDLFRQVGVEFGSDIFGGSGNDRLDLSGWTNSILAFSVNLADEAYALLPNGFGVDGTYLLQDVEDVTGSNFDDSITGSVGANRLDGGDGNDSINGEAENDSLSGGNGADHVYGGTGNDSLSGDAGGDHLWGGAGADAHFGGDGIDYARYDDANHGNLVIRLDAPGLNTGAAAGDTYTGIEGLVGGAGNDLVVGDALNNFLFGSGGADQVYGGVGDDYLSGDAGGDNLWGGAGADAHYGGNDAGVDYARYDDANHGNLTLRLDNSAGNAGTAAVGDTYTGIEGLVGGAGNDVIIGNTAANFLFGQGGADFIDGQGGNDYLNGGAGADRFRFSTALSGSNVDQIADFQHLVDDILLVQSIFAGIGAALTADEFRIGMALDANDRILYNNGTGQIFYDSNANGAGGMVLFATVTAGTVLTFDDFIMV